MRRANLRIIGIEESKDLHLKGPVNTFNKIIEENLPNLNKVMPMNKLEVYRTPNSLDQNKSLSSTKFENLDKMVNFLDTYQVPTL